MKITTSENYYHEYDCCIEDCDRLYCNTHRLLYRSCETAVRGIEGDRDVINGTREVIEVTGDCPECKRDYERKKWEAIMKAQRTKQVVWEELRDALERWTKMNDDLAAMRSVNKQEHAALRLRIENLTRELDHFVGE